MTAIALGSTNLYAAWTGTVYYTPDGRSCATTYVNASPGASCEVKPFCEGKPLCTACESGGKACDGNGQCKTGKDLITQICNQLGITYENQRTPSCSDGRCGVVIEYDITRVTHSCDSVSLGGANLTETITTDEGCLPGGVEIGPGCPISSDNTLSCKDNYSICGPSSNFPSGTCTEVYTQKLFVGTCLAETRTITFKITKTSTSCSGTVTRN